jgi:hypothetical protein
MAGQLSLRTRPDRIDISGRPWVIRKGVTDRRFPDDPLRQDRQMDPVDEGWRFVSIGLEGQATDIGGVNPWDVEWTPTDGRITVAHPQHNGVWGFFVPI